MSARLRHRPPLVAGVPRSRHTRRARLASNTAPLDAVHYCDSTRCGLTLALRPRVAHPQTCEVSCCCREEVEKEKWLQQRLDAARADAAFQHILDLRWEIRRYRQVEMEFQKSSTMTANFIIFTLRACRAWTRLRGRLYWPRHGKMHRATAGCGLPGTPRFDDVSSPCCSYTRGRMEEGVVV